MAPRNIPASPLSLSEILTVTQGGFIQGLQNRSLRLHVRSIGHDPRVATQGSEALTFWLSIKG